jgi:PKHD-type hydroxylase
VTTNDAVAAFLVRPGAFTDDDCEALLRTVQSRATVPGEIVKDAARTTERRSTIRWLDRDRDRAVIRRVRSVLRELNDAWFHFDIDGIEPIQLARYGVGDRYDPHIDLGPGATSRRKLSISVQLSDPQSYGGGDLAFRGVVPPKSRNRGTAIVFPSYLEHAVQPVERGERWSLVAWAVGPPFR